MPNRLYYGDNLDVLRRYVPDASVDLVYLDPPFNSNANHNVLFAESVTLEEHTPVKPAENGPAIPVWHGDDGTSRLLLGDSLAFMEQLPADSVDCIWTDPPYLLSNDGITCVAGKMVKVNKGEWDRSRGVDLDHEFNRTWLAACHRILKPSGAIWVSGTLHVYLSVGMAMQQLGFRILNDIVWEKPAPPPNLGCRCFTHSTEVLLWATKAKKGGKDRHKFNYAAMRAENAGKQMKSVWRFSTPAKEEKRHGKHPTQKPLALIARCLRATTDPGDLVFDPFTGSGSTGVAALTLGRHFVGCEQDKAYAKLACTRLTDAMGGVVDLGTSAARPTAPVQRIKSEVRQRPGDLFS